MKVAVLGLGSIGLRHAKHALALGADVVGYDPGQSQREAFRQSGGRAVDSREAAISEVDAVVIATPNEHHLEDLRMAVEAGCHAFVEKPIAHTLAGLAAILDEAESRNRCVSVGFNLRIHPTVIAARQILAHAGLGTLLWARLVCASYLPDWRPSQDYRKGYAASPMSGGMLFDISHEFDLARYLLGPAEVVACASRRTGILEIESEDCSDVILRHASGVQSTMHLDYTTRPPLRVTEIVGSEGMVRLDLQRRRFQHIGTDGRILEEESYATSFNDDYAAEMKSFFACCRGRERPACDGRDALETLALVVQARRHSADCAQ